MPEVKVTDEAEDVLKPGLSAEMSPDSVLDYNNGAYLSLDKINFVSAVPSLTGINELLDSLNLEESRRNQKSTGSED